MRPVILFAVCCSLLASSCRSQKSVQKDIALTTDSVAHSAHHRTFATLDTAAIRLSLDFDTLEISRIRRDAADTVEIVRLKAVKGQVLSHRSQHRQIAEEHERLDTLAYKLASADKSAEHSSTTRVYDPPNATGIILFALLIIGGIAYIYFHRK